MKVITPAHLESWKQSVPALIKIDYGPVEPLRSETGAIASPALVPILCTFGNVIPRLEPTTERYFLDTRVNGQATLPS